MRMGPLPHECPDLQKQAFSIADENQSLVEDDGNMFAMGMTPALLRRLGSTTVEMTMHMMGIKTKVVE